MLNAIGLQNIGVEAFLRDKLNLPATDVGGGWLLFDLPDAEMGCHPSETDQGPVPSGTAHVSFYCDDIQKTVAELKERGVEFTGGIEDHGYGFVTYFAVRKLTEGSVEDAVANAHAIIDFQRSLGIYVEPALNDAAASRPWALTVINWIYIWGHWPLIAAVGLWLLRAQPAGYALIRNAFFISGAVGFFFFALFPTAPPRLAAPEFVDTVTEFSRSYRVFQPPEITNQYAAFPSLHFGWNLLIGIALARYARWTPLRILGGLSPVGMLAATVFTANHYLVDIAMGAIVALFGLAVAAAIARMRAEEAAGPQDVADPGFGSPP